MTDVKQIEIRKDPSYKPSRPWAADVIWKDGKVWTSWCYGYRTKKALLAHIEAVNPQAPVVQR